MSAAPIPFAFNGVIIRRDEAERVSLTDLWKAAGRPRKKKPTEWLARESTVDLLDMAQSLITPKMGQLEFVASQAGRHGGTYAQQTLALSYAKWLSPELHLAVNQVFFERQAEERDPDKILDRAEAAYRRRGFTESQIQARFMGKASRSRLVSVLSHHGVKTPNGFRLCTNATYKPLWGGEASHIRQRKQLSEKANTREHMSEKELVVLHLAEILAAESIEQKKVRGNKACALECARAAQSVARLIVQHKQGNHLPPAS
ncbi:KilA-N domain-containing protein [Hymenobacter profundi]|uniref:KilA-N domain-containing protein n=1 Tax=Hymenobacter profundi TaxID=1982110 RepID=A0ABS6WZ66_9BACT|nr:KilA-N domain-containing protein [Hymenobacter profundi]MBW3128860.1 KilA-N domain-containing protein [Hymenobacter profundi]